MPGADTSVAAASNDLSPIAFFVVSIVPVAIVFGVGWLLLVMYQNRRLGGKGQFALFRRALKDSEVPPNANAAAWLGVLRRQAELMAKRTWRSWVLIAAFAAVFVGMNIKSAVEASDTNTGRTLAVLVPLTILAVFIGLVTKQARRQRRREHQLRAALEALPG
jgi:amino acid transporter